MKILVVEDNEFKRNSLRDLLMSEGIGVIVAENGREALIILKDFGFDLIVSDIVMPLMDGFTLAKEVKASKDKATPFLIYSSRYPPEDEDIELARWHGVDHYIHAVGIPGVKDEVINYLKQRS